MSRPKSMIQDKRSSVMIPETSAHQVEAIVIPAYKQRVDPLLQKGIYGLVDLLKYHQQFSTNIIKALTRTLEEQHTDPTETQNIQTHIKKSLDTQLSVYLNKNKAAIERMLMEQKMKTEEGVSYFETTFRKRLNKLPTQSDPGSTVEDCFKKLELDSNLKTRSHLTKHKTIVNEKELSFKIQSLMEDLREEALPKIKQSIATGLIKISSDSSNKTQTSNASSTNPQISLTGTPLSTSSLMKTQSATIPSTTPQSSTTRGLETLKPDQESSPAEKISSKINDREVQKTRVKSVELQDAPLEAKKVEEPKKTAVVRPVKPTERPNSHVQQLQNQEQKQNKPHEFKNQSLPHQFKLQASSPKPTGNAQDLSSKVQKEDNKPGVLYAKHEVLDVKPVVPDVKPEETRIAGPKVQPQEITTSHLQIKQQQKENEVPEIKPQENRTLTFVESNSQGRKISPPEVQTDSNATNFQNPPTKPELKVQPKRPAPPPPSPQGRMDPPLLRSGIQQGIVRTQASNFEQNNPPEQEKHKKKLLKKVVSMRLPNVMNNVVNQFKHNKNIHPKELEVQAVMSLEDAKRIAGVQQVSLPKEDIQTNVFSPTELSIFRKSSSPTLCFFITTTKIYVNIISGDISNPPQQGQTRIFEPIQKFTHYHHDAGNVSKPVEDTFNILKLLKQNGLPRIRLYEVLPEEIIKEYFLLLSQKISQEFDNPIRNHIAIHPAMFSELQVQRLKSATACLQNCRIINLQTILGLSLTNKVGDVFGDVGISKKALILHCTAKHFQTAVASVTRSRTDFLSWNGDQYFPIGSPDTIMFVSRHQQLCEHTRNEDHSLEDKIKTEAGQFYEKFINETMTAAGIKSLDNVLFVFEGHIGGLRKYFSKSVGAWSKSKIEEIPESNLFKVNGFKEAVLKLTSNEVQRQ